MNNSENKELLVNYGQGVIVIPEAVMGVVSSAKKNDIIVLLALLSDKDASTASVAEKFAMSEEAVERAIAFWRGAGIITYGEEKKSEPAAETKEEKKTAKKGRRGDLGSLPEYSSNEIAEMVENDRDVALMIDECERALGKIFRVGETAKILALRDYLGFSPEYISTLCEYCAGIGKTSVRYLETTAIALYDDGITDKAALEEHLRAVRAKHELETQIRSLFGMNMSRALTTKEKKFIDSWIGSFGYGIEVIKLAYEITVDKIQEPSLNYANAILESWNAKGLKTEDEVKAQIDAEAEAKGEPAAGKSFDSTDFFEAALRRSYSDSGAVPDVPKTVPAPKKRK
ncbi:MAG: DnaD domain protein [Clostridia bacterium]|nr:DnaD domain protein [Clostridia bacterium]